MEKATKMSLWTSIAVGSFTAITAIIGSNIQGFTWLLYLCGVVLSTSFAILVWNSFLGAALDYYSFKIRKKKHLKSRFGNYSRIVKRFNILQDIDCALSIDKVDWCNCRPHLFGSMHNSLHNIENCLADMPPEHKIIATNILLKEMVISFDGWLRICDCMLKNGHAKYKTEGARNEVLHLIRKYDELTSTHDEVCQEINSIIDNKQSFLVGLYCKPHGFNWRKAEPQLVTAE